MNYFPKRKKKVIPNWKRKFHSNTDDYDNKDWNEVDKLVYTSTFEQGNLWQIVFS